MSWWKTFIGGHSHSAFHYDLLVKRKFLLYGDERELFWHELSLGQFLHFSLYVLRLLSHVLLIRVNCTAQCKLLIPFPGWRGRFWGTPSTLCIGRSRSLSRESRLGQLQALSKACKNPTHLWFEKMFQLKKCTFFLCTFVAIWSMRTAKPYQTAVFHKNWVISWHGAFHSAWSPNKCCKIICSVARITHAARLYI